MIVKFESVDDLLKELDEQIKQEEKECFAILDTAIFNIRKAKEVEEDAKNIEL